jgi:uncharacterized protein (TIGR03118 family)
MAFTQTNLDSNVAGNAEFPDANLTNAWGLAFVPGGAFWVNGNHSGTSNLFKGDGSIASLVVTIPSPSGAVSAPTGILANPTTAFFVPGSKLAAAFIFDTEDGTVAAWNPGVDATHAVIAVDNSRSGAVYKGLAFGSNVSGNHIYATNFSAGTIDVFDSTFAPVATDGQFIDQHIRPGFAPFGIQNIDGDLWVTYAKQDAEKMDDAAAPGNGFVDVFDTDGHLLRRFAQHGALNSGFHHHRRRVSRHAVDSEIHAQHRRPCARLCAGVHSQQQPSALSMLRKPKGAQSPSHQFD